MKKITLAIALILGMGIAQNSFGSSNPDELDKVIRKSMSYPAFAKNEKMQGLVLVKYAVQDDGTVRVLEMNASHSKLAQYVKDRLEGIVVADTSATGVHFAKFTFRFESR